MSAYFWRRYCCKKNDLHGFEKHIDFLTSLYRLRSQGAAHRKDTKDYPKIRAKYKIDKQGYIKTFKEILSQAISLLEFFIVYAGETKV